MIEGLWLRIYGSGFLVQVLGTPASEFRVQGSGFRVKGVEFSVQGLGLRVQGPEFRSQDLGFRG